MKQVRCNRHRSFVGAARVSYGQCEECQRPDLHAFLLLDELFPGTRDMVSGAKHNEIYLDIDDEQAETLTDDQIIELVRCGVRLDDDGSGLCMFA